MNRDKIKLYVLEILLLLVLFLALFVSNIFNRTVLAILLFVFAIITRIFIKRKKAASIYKKQVVWLMFGFSIIYIVVFYLMGLYFGYYKAPTTFGLATVIKFILPLATIIYSSELIRKTIIVQDSKLSKVLISISMVLIDLIVYSGVYDITNMDDMLTVLGFIFFASIACNLLYNYITVRYSSTGVIIYRMITVLYIYLIPYIPDVYLFFRTFLRMLYPYIIYVVLDYTYSKTNYASQYKDRKKNMIWSTVSLIITAIIIALISCQFRLGILVIGSGSMTGTIDKGDAIIYESYKNDSKVKSGTVIVFEKDNIQIVHRVVDVISSGGTLRYYTKGDANKKIDDGYITSNDIHGIVKFKIPYIGYPSLWIRDLFKK